MTLYNNSLLLIYLLMFAKYLIDFLSVKRKLTREFPDVDEVVIEVALRTVSLQLQSINYMFPVASTYL